MESLLSNSDNLFKFILITGISLLVLSIAYPLEKSQAIGLEITRLEGQNDILKFKGEVLDKRIKELQVGEVSQMQKDSIVKAATDFKILALENKSHAKIISELTRQRDEFKTLDIIMRYMGIGLILLGLSFWSWLTFMSAKKHELICKKKVTPTPQ